MIHGVMTNSGYHGLLCVLSPFNDVFPIDVDVLSVTGAMAGGWLSFSIGVGTIVKAMSRSMVGLGEFLPHLSP